MKRKILPLISAVIIPLLLLFSCAKDEIGSEITYKPDPQEQARSVFLRTKGLGSCASLEGRVHFTAVFVSEPASSWNEEQTAAALEAMQKTLKHIGTEAERYGVSLELSLGKAVSRIKSTAPPEPDYYSWLGEALEAAGLGSVKDADMRLREAHSADSAPIVFFFNREGRAYASSASDSGLEYCVAYTAEEDSLAHEILHMYGAQDLYYPDEVKRLAAETLGESIMNGGTLVDALTAYLVGWCGEPGDEARQFLDDLTVTEKDLEKALAAETYTGFASREFNNGKYVGELVFGVADGRGTMTYNEGHVYEGEWKENLPHGTGSMTWANGDTYMGEWKKGKRDGTGTYTWADGSVYVGGYKADRMHGRGVLTYSDGSVVSGIWEDGELITQNG